MIPRLSSTAKKARSHAQVRIGRLRRSQLAEAADLLATQLREHDVTSGQAALKQILSQIVRREALGFVLVAIGPRSQVIGVALGCAFLGLEHQGPSGWLEELYVRPEFRNQGIGTRLVRDFTQTAKRAGWRAIDLEVDAGHRRVISLYQRSGFTALPRRRLTLRLKS